MVELMIGNAIDKTLDSIGHSECHSMNENVTLPGSPAYNETFCDSLKVEMAVTLAFLTGIIMVQYTLSINFGQFFVRSGSVHYAYVYS